MKRCWITALATALVLTGLSANAVAAKRKTKDVCVCMISEELATVDLALIERHYLPAFVENSKECAFPGQQQAVIKAWNSLLSLIGNRFRQNGNSWGRPTLVINRVYFSDEGRIDHFLYQMLTDDTDTEKEYCKAVNEIAHSYVFPIKADQAFSQVGRSTYVDTRRSD